MVEQREGVELRVVGVMEVAATVAAATAAAATVEAVRAVVD